MSERYRVQATSRGGWLVVDDAFAAPIAEAYSETDADLILAALNAGGEDAMTNETRGFHWRDGWYFKRLEAGAVKIEKWREWPGLEGNRILEMQAEIPAAEWASIIAEVSGDPTRYEDAERFHAGASR